MKVPLIEFGRDHWSTLAYVETRVVDAGGRLDVIRMRCDRRRHPTRAHLAVAMDVQEHPTRLRGGVVKRHHDDWDCLDDMEEAGLLTQRVRGPDIEVQLTEFGFALAAALRKHLSTKRTSGSAYETFAPEQFFPAVAGTEG